MTVFLEWEAEEHGYIDWVNHTLLHYAVWTEDHFIPMNNKSASKFKKKIQEHLRFTNQSLCEDILTWRMQILRCLRMKCSEEYLDQGGIVTGWISIHMRSVCRDSEQLKETVFSLTLELLGFLPFGVLSSTF
jgi:hypothetical protein